MRKIRIKLVLAALCLLPGLVTKAQEEKYQVAYLYNFTNFIEWPDASSTSPFIIGVVGQNAPIIPELQNLAKMKKVHGRTISVKVFRDVQSVAACHILFVSEKFENQISSVEQNIASSGVLLVSDSPDAVTKGAAISFVLLDGKLNFKLAPQNAEKNGLKVNSRLAALAVK